MEPKKLLELKGDDFLKGQSIQPTLPRGGIFRSSPGFDPFETEGYLQPSLEADEIDAPSTNGIKTFTDFNSSGTEYVYAHSNTKLYQYLRNTPFTQTDKTAEINVTDSPFCGAIIWKGRYIYAQKTDLRSNILPVASGSDVQILNGSNSSDLDIRALCIGSDKNLYVGDYGSVGKCVLHTGTAGNALDAFTIDAGYTVRDIVNDGYYLVIFADNNAVTTTNRKQGSYSCKIYFWDCSSSKTTADIIYDLPGNSYIIGAEIVGNAIKVFTYEGIYVCNSGTPPRKIWSFTGNSTITKRPMTPYQITNDGETVYWGDGETNGQYVYANRGNAFYIPYITHGSSAKHTALNFSSGVLFAGIDTPKVYVLNTGTTRGNATAQTANIVLSGLYKLSYIKVTLKEKMSSGQAVSVNLFNSDDDTIMDTNTKSFTTLGAKKTLKFDPKPGAIPISQFEDFYLQINPQGGATVQRVVVYGIPCGDDGQQI